MKRIALLTIGAGSFGLLLLYLSIASSPPLPPTGIEHSADGAEEACAEAVGERVADARFPFAANVTYRGDADYALNGTVEIVADGERVRRLYECRVRYRGAGAYTADSVAVWQSH